MKALNRKPVIPEKAGIQWPNCVTPNLYYLIQEKLEGAGFHACPFFASSSCPCGGEVLFNSMS